MDRTQTAETADQCNNLPRVNKKQKHEKQTAWWNTKIYTDIERKLEIKHSAAMGEHYCDSW